MSNDERTRRRWLETCAGATVGMALLAGCSSSDDSPDDGGSSDDDSQAGSGAADVGEYGSWPMIRYNAANRLSVPHDGVEGEPEILWEANLDGTVSQPVVYDDVAFVGHGSGMYSAIDLQNGESIWEHQTDGRSAPAVTEHAVYVAGNGVEALDREEGDVLWETGHEESVESIRVFDGEVYAGLKDHVVVLDSEGDEILGFETRSTVQSLAIDDERIYVRSRLSSGEGKFVIACYDRTSSDFLWEEEIGQTEQWSDDRHTKTFPVIEGIVYTVDGASIIRIDGANGEREEIVELEREPWTRPTVHNGTIFCRTDRPVKYDIGTGEEISDWIPEENTKEAVVIGGGAVYAIRGTGITSPQNVMAMDEGLGDLNWEKAAPEVSNNHVPVVLNDMILVSIDDPGLIAFG